jgi:hypothetical protein
MMTSGGAVHYKSMFDAASQIVAKEGVKSLFKGAGANILRGVAGAGVLSMYDKMQELVFGKVYAVSLFYLRWGTANKLGWIRINVSRLLYSLSLYDPSTKALFIFYTFRFSYILFSLYMGELWYDVSDADMANH